MHIKILARITDAATAIIALDCLKSPNAPFFTFNVLFIFWSISFERSWIPEDVETHIFQIYF